MIMTTVAATSTATPTLSSETPPVMASDPESALAILEVETGSQAEQADRSDRESAELQEEQQNEAAVAAMHDKASHMRTQAWMDFGVAVTDACVQASAGGDGGSGSGASSDSQTAALFKSCQSLLDGMQTADEADDDADVKGDTSGATAAGFAVQADGEALTDASDLVKAALGAYQQYVTTQAQTQAAALHRA
jgi:hypothetical protein